MATIHRSSRPAQRFNVFVLGLAVALAFCLFIVVLIRTAWMCDDAYITLRTVDNLVNGYGLRYNVAERVQTFTHPLWLFVLTPFYFLTREGYYTPLALSLVISLFALIVFVMRAAVSLRMAVLGVIILTVSRSFVDYSTSGLENPLSHLLIVAFCAVYLRMDDSPRKLLLLAVSVGLAALNRQDLLLLLLPALLAAVWLHIRSGQVRLARGAGIVALGLLPLIGWLAFSVFYYGFAFPNTAYAKLNTGISQLLLIEQGFAYLGNALREDPITPLVIAAALVAALVSRRPRLLSLAAGIVLYVAYTVWIGGDFMSGRFLAAPLLVAVVILCNLELRRGAYLAAVSLAVLVGLLSPRPVLLAGFDYAPPESSVFSAIDAQGIADERAFYYPATGFLSVGRRSHFPSHEWALQGLAAREQPVRVVVRDPLGMYGFMVGPGQHLVDTYALADPLLARLPVKDPLDWRVGHYRRRIPDGYLATLETGRNQIADPSLAAYYDALSLITRGPLWSGERLAAIWRMNTGQYDHLLEGQ
jgi:arabinofuranosyltransferase